MSSIMDKYKWKNGSSRSAVVGMEEERRSGYQSSDGRREREKNCPSFSSTLLDQIYRSMDGEEDDDDDQLVLYAGRKLTKKQYNYPTIPSTTATSTSWKKEKQQDAVAGNYSLGRIDKWMEKKKATASSSTNQNKIIILNHHHHNSTAAAYQYYPRRKSAAENGDEYSSCCCRSSSGSSSGDYLFSSSEAESTSKTTSSSSSSYTTKYTPKPTRVGSSTHRLSSSSSSTCTSNHYQQPQKFKQTSSIAAGTSILQNQEMKLLVKKRSDEKHQQGSSTKTNYSGDHFSKTKSKALKIYADLKKVKQPLSPGGKLASFFTSIFNNNNTTNDHNNNINKKAKMTLVSSNEEEVISKSKYSAHHHASSNCSSASSFSRTTSCLSKSSTTQPSTCKRSVRFYPLTTVIVDGKDCLQTTAAASQRDKRDYNDSGIREMKWRGEEVARDLFKRSVDCKNIIMDIDHEEEEEEECDDDASCASSDLFELDNLNSHHTFQRYGEELPVYETTYFDTNRAIANGLIM